jgi:hypothetical protein
MSKILNFKKVLERESAIFLTSLTGGGSIMYNPQTLFELDQEDVEYFKNKYLPKLNEEMEERIAKIKEEYENGIF